MPKFTFTLFQTIRYECEVNAKTREQAGEKLQEMIDDDEDLGEVEIDNGPFEIEED